MKKYLVYPGSVISQHDGERHFLDFGHLCELYGIPTREAINMFDPLADRRADRSSMVSLHPLTTGNYRETLAAARQQKPVDASPNQS